MKKLLVFILLLIILKFFAFSLNENFKIVKIIGDQEGYIFSSISDAILTSDKDIIILDGKGNTILKYDWDGNLINRIGQKGQGPGDFFWPTSVNIYNEKIYFLDRFNNRFVEADLDLKNLKYFRLPLNSMAKYIDVIDNNKFIIDNSSFDKPDGNKICIIDKNMKIIKAFFTHTPIDLNSTKKEGKILRRLSLLSKITYAMDDNLKKMLIAFHISDNPIVFYLYSIDGELIRKFSYQMDKKYHFVHELYTSEKVSLSTFKGKHSINVGSIFYYNNHWYIFVSTDSYKSGNHKLTVRNLFDYVETKSYYLKFEKSGKLIGKFEVNPHFECFYISKEGYFLGKHPHSDLEELMIYKIIK
jgi:hypothetical protein